MRITAAERKLNAGTRISPASLRRASRRAESNRAVTPRLRLGSRTKLAGPSHRAPGPTLSSSDGKQRHCPSRTRCADARRRGRSPTSRLPTAHLPSLSARPDPPEQGIRPHPPRPGHRTPPRPAPGPAPQFPAPGPTPRWDVIKKTPKAQRPVPGRRSPALPASPRTGIRGARPSGGRRRPPGGRKRQGACALDRKSVV